MYLLGLKIGAARGEADLQVMQQGTILRAANARIEFPAVKHFTEAASGRRWFFGVTSWQHLAIVGKDQADFWPLLSNFVPGGLYDSSGQHFVFQDVTNIPRQPFWTKPLVPFVGASKFLGNLELDIIVQQPKQLSMKDYCTALGKLAWSAGEVQGISRRKMRELILASKSYREAIYCLLGSYIFDHETPPWRPPEDSAVAAYERHEKLLRERKNRS